MVPDVILGALARVPALVEHLDRRQVPELIVAWGRGHVSPIVVVVVPASDDLVVDGHDPGG
jgi:hypothetical protein